jgi:radical SAM superfamily enzyme YgiQ (UPF0313 family)
MRILLIDPPFKRFTGITNFYFPIGLAYLAAILRNVGHSVTVFEADAVVKGSDIDFTNEYIRLESYRRGINEDTHKVWGEIKTVLEEFKPELVGITAMTTKFGSVLKTAEIVKKHDSGIPVVCGGPHVTLLPEQTLKSGDIDIVVRGEGEKTFPELINALKDNSCLKGIKGISFKHNGDIFHNPDQDFIEDLNALPFPERGALMNSRNYTSEDMGMIMASRGCPFNCSYCCHPWGKRVRSRSVKNVIEEIRMVKEKYGSRQFEFKDDTFTVNKNWVKEFCGQLISDSIKINWGCTTRADFLDEELVRLMKKAGCNVIKLGIETGSERILKETKKGVTFEQMKQAAVLLNKYGIFWSGYFMIGLPTETEDDIRKTFEFMKQLNPYYAGLGVYNPFPQTELFEQAAKLGLLHSDIDLNHFFKTNPKDYFFVNPSKRQIYIRKEEFDGLVKLLSKGFHKHNTKLKNIIRRGWARRLAYSADFKLLLNDIFKALKWVNSN